MPAMNTEVIWDNEDATEYERKGDCWIMRDRAIFSKLKTWTLNYEKFKTKEAAKLSIIDYLAFL